MPRKAPPLTCSKEQRLELERLASNPTNNRRFVERVKVILLSLKSLKNKDIARKLNIRPNTVSEIRKRFIAKGINGLYDQPRSGKPKKYGNNFRTRVLNLINSDPPNGYTNWDGALIAEKLNASTQAVWRLLRKEGIQLSRRRNWNIDTDPHFLEKTVDIVGIFLSSALNAFVIAVSEQPRWQPSRLQTGSVVIKNRKINQTFETNLKQDNSLKLLDALVIASKNIDDRKSKDKTQPSFFAFIEGIVAELSVQEEIHVILDVSSSKENNERQQRYPNVFFHLTHSRDSWFTHIELWTSIFSNKRHRGIDFNKITELKAAIETYIIQTQQTTRPFIWKKESISE